MPQHRKYNDRYNGSPLTFYNTVNLLIDVNRGIARK